MTKQRGLGKGLGALLGEAAMQTAQPPSGAQLLPLQKVEPNPLQPRKSFDPDELQALADSIAMHGIIQPLTVRQLRPASIRSSPVSAAGAQPGSRDSTRFRSS